MTDTLNLLSVLRLSCACCLSAGMLVFGALGDVIGRKWGSRMTASIMLSGAILLVFTALVPSPLAYLRFFIFAQTL